MGSWLILLLIQCGYRVRALARKGWYFISHLSSNVVIRYLPRWPVWPNTCYVGAMTAEAWVQLMEEMMDLKIQQFAESTMKLSPEVSKLLHDKKETDRRRLAQIRAELIRTLDA